MPMLSHIKIQDIDLAKLKAELKQSGVTVKMARLDRIHAFASGNKIYKLSPIIAYAKDNNFKQILSFGGAYSNHIHALALMAKEHNIESIAVIRGEPHYAVNPTLSDAQNAGMRLLFVNREEYKQRNNQEYITQLQQRFPEALIIPEGGSSQLAIQGCAQMARDINQNIQHGLNQDLNQDLNQQSVKNSILTIASGTGATAGGLVCGLAEHQRLIAYSVLKDESLKLRIDGFIDAEKSDNHHSYEIQNADFGGYAKFDKPLLDFILGWLEQTGILLDPIYTSKMCRRVIQQIEAGEFTRGQSITLIHSGGLQGWRGMQKRVQLIAGTNAWEQISDYLKDD